MDEEGATQIDLPPVRLHLDHLLHLPPHVHVHRGPVQLPPRLDPHPRVGPLSLALVPLLALADLPFDRSLGDDSYLVLAAGFYYAPYQGPEEDSVSWPLLGSLASTSPASAASGLLAGAGAAVMDPLSTVQKVRALFVSLFV